MQDNIFVLFFGCCIILICVSRMDFRAITTINPAAVSAALRVDLLIIYYIIEGTSRFEEGTVDVGMKKEEGDIQSLRPSSVSDLTADLVPNIDR